MSASYARTPPPRPLGASETLESLTHWKTTFRTFFKRDETYKPFIRDTAKWDSAAANYAQQEEATGLKRSAADMKEDLVDLLNTLSGFLPHSYLTDKILKATKNWIDVWNVIHDHYGVQVTSETLLDFESLQKQTGETHRQFYERLLQHVRQHLAPAGVKVEQINTGASADEMSVSMLNMVALQWLRKTDPALIKIVRTEYSTELRNNTQLAELVPRISINIDSLLTRYNHGATTNKVELEEETNQAMDTLAINKTWGKPFQQGRTGRSRDQPAYRGSGYRGAGSRVTGFRRTPASSACLTKCTLNMTILRRLELFLVNKFGLDNLESMSEILYLRTKLDSVGHKRHSWFKNPIKVLALVQDYLIRKHGFNLPTGKGIIYNFICFNQNNLIFIFTTSSNFNDFLVRRH